MQVPQCREDKKLNRVLAHVRPGGYDTASLGALSEKGFDYFIWDEENWSKADLELVRTKYNDMFAEVRAWEKSYLGKVILFKVNN